MFQCALETQGVLALGILNILYFMVQTMFVVRARACWILAASLLAGSALAQSPEATPAPVVAPVSLTAHEVVKQVTDEMLSVINANKVLLSEKPDVYFEEVAKVLEPVVAFDYIAKVVMAKYYDTATPAQRVDFAEAFKKGMVETFAKGMANYSDFEINVMPSSADTSGQRKVEVLQEVKSKDGTLVVSYTMANDKTGEWKLINVVLNGINLGKSFRDQFVQATRQYSGNLDKVIATWGQKDA